MEASSGELFVTRGRQGERRAKRCKIINVGRGVAGNRAKEALGTRDSTGVRRARVGVCVHLRVHLCPCMRVHVELCVCTSVSRQLHTFQVA